MAADASLVLATLALTLATVALALVSTSGSRNQMWLTTFGEYTKRYADILDLLPFEVGSPGGVFDPGALSPEKQTGSSVPCVGTSTCVGRNVTFSRQEDSTGERGRFGRLGSPTRCVLPTSRPVGGYCGASLTTGWTSSHTWTASRQRQRPSARRPPMP